MSTGNQAAGSSSSGFLAELFSARLYKKSQGRVARQVTLLGLALVAAVGGFRLSGWMDAGGYGQVPSVLVPLGVFAAAVWASFRWIHLPRFADFLISVEAEMNKVSWPGKSELWKASVVVILTIFVLAGLLFAYDLVWKTIIGGLLSLGS